MIRALILCSVVVVIQASSTVLKAGSWTEETTCEHEALKISCPPGETIDILCANYGRTDKKTCLHGPILTSECFGKSSIPTVKSSCQGRQKCTLMASNSVFGDPCPGTFKFLTVDYTCRGISPPKKALVCEHQRLNLNCSNPDATISIIDANYGRTDRSTCNTGPISSTSCSAKKSVEILRSRCDGKPSCSVAAGNSVFGDPCPGTFKYLDVSFTCLTGPDNGHGENEVVYKPREMYEDMNVLACDGTWSTLICNPGYHITVTESDYGRSGGFNCGNSSTDAANCTNPKHALKVAKEICNGKETCRIESSSKLFGDHCINTSKYLNLTFHCALPPERVEGATRKAVACENDNIFLDCGRTEPDEDAVADPSALHLTISILDANYGRHDNATCLRGPVATKECFSKATTMDIVQNRCGGKTFCKIKAVNNIFGDPCFNTYKYLEIDYTCTSDNSVLDGGMRNITVCEHERLELTCPKRNGSRLVIHEANYGRTDLAPCSTGQPVLTANCNNQVKSLNVVSEKCAGKNSCSLTAHNAEFGDPCVGTFKYLTVLYSCEMF